ncbi:hypothetical protein [Natrinema saccharevitans]|uniref:hypothetical protein n=1 Tax=Natrinema saccharevitans TaxID=301967 RepID=UPI00111577F7|nr:hypothetical protein [Natrinema saccharevitans]
MTDRLVSDEELVERVAECIAAGETIPAGGASPTTVAAGLSISASTADKHLRRLADAGRLERDFGVRNGARKTGYRPVPEDRCDRCDGDGEIERADRTVPCPHCHGVGRTDEERELRADGGDGTSLSGTDRIQWIISKKAISPRITNPLAKITLFLSTQPLAVSDNSIPKVTPTKRKKITAAIRCLWRIIVTPSSANVAVEIIRPISELPTIIDIYARVISPFLGLFRSLQTDSDLPEGDA